MSVADAEVFILAEGNILVAVIARTPGAAGVSSPRHAFKGILQELGIMPSSANTERF